jgi:hypothetical protein
VQPKDIPIFARKKLRKLGSAMSKGGLPEIISNKSHDDLVEIVSGKDLEIQKLRRLLDESKTKVRHLKEMQK